MRKLFLSLMFLAMIAGVLAVPETNVSYFYSTTCVHCAKVHDSGILENVSEIDGVSLEKYEISINDLDRQKMENFAEGFCIPVEKRGIPFLVIEQNGKYSYLLGDVPIIADLKNSVENFEGVELGSCSNPGGFEKLNFFKVVVAALIDSINPCAFGVLLFLMAALLKMGSSRRAFRAGIIYSFVIFVVYLAAGFGIMKLFSSFNILNDVKIFVGVLLLIGGLIEIKDFFFEGKGFSLKIPTSVKPTLEKYSRRGTLLSLVVLGALVALVELPCTGGIYLAVLSLIADKGTLGIFYLVIYNLVFILPLILISYFVSKGASVGRINSWVQDNKKWMRLSAGLIMILLALYLTGFLRI